MNDFGRRLASATSITLIAAVTVLTMRLSVAEEQPSGATQPAVQTALNPGSGPAHAAPVNPKTSNIRPVDKGEPALGADPDPEAFDRRGLEIWWQRYQARDRAPE